MGFSTEFDDRGSCVGGLACDDEVAVRDWSSMLEEM